MKKRKPKTERQKSIRQLKKELWTVFSKYIRHRDKYTCITCETVMQDKPSSAHAGHYVPQSKGNALRYDERNVNCQCASCNVYKRGNLSIYALKLEQMYGMGILQEFDEIRHTVWKPTHEELEAKIAYYKEYLARI